MTDDKMAVTAKSPEQALEEMMGDGEKDPKKLIAGLRAKGFTISEGIESEDDEMREGEPMPPDLDDAIGGAVKDAMPPMDL